MATAVEIAWASGLFEGEGCITWAVRPERNDRMPAPHLIVISTDHDVLEKFHRIVGCGRIASRTVPAAKNHWKEQWSWECRVWADAARVLGMFLPFLGERRSARALQILESCHQNRERSCSWCGDVFMARMAKARYCSRVCNSRAQKERQRDPSWRSTRV